jgi:hypothetical protein
VGYSTVVGGTTITASWGNANVRDQVVTPFASTSARDSAITSPVTGMVAYVAGLLCAYNGNAWVCITPVNARTAADQTTTSTSYTDLATAGPALTLETDTKALVTLSSVMYNSGSLNNTHMGFAVSGATTLAAADARAIVIAGDVGASTSAEFLVTGLTAGPNTFTAKYRVNAGTGHYDGAAYHPRSITVVGIP